MIAAVHASIGAVLGSVLGTRSGAFLAGFVSHLAADMVPHKDYPPKIEVPLVLASLAGIAAWKGVDSPEIWGALGAITPDSEHALVLAGIITPDQEVYPTHLKGGIYHAREAKTRWGQLLVAAAAVAVVAWHGTNRSDAHRDTTMDDVTTGDGIEMYTPKRIAEFLLNNAIGEDDFARAIEQVKAMGIDPDDIPHGKQGPA